jgi:hypothetical protein
LGVKISTGPAASEAKPTFEAAEATPKPVETAPAPKKKVHITKPDPATPKEFLEGTPSDEGMVWMPMDDAPKDKVILVAIQSPSQPTKWDYREVMWFAGPTGSGWYVVGTMWHQLNAESVRGWIDEVGHP